MWCQASPYHPVLTQSSERSTGPRRSVRSVAEYRRRVWEELGYRWISGTLSSCTQQHEILHCAAEWRKHRHELHQSSWTQSEHASWWDDWPSSSMRTAWNAEINGNDVCFTVFPSFQKQTKKKKPFSTPPEAKMTQIWAKKTKKIAEEFRIFKFCGMLLVFFSPLLRLSSGYCLVSTPEQN